MPTNTRKLAGMLILFLLSLVTFQVDAQNNSLMVFYQENDGLYSLNAESGEREVIAEISGVAYFSHDRQWVAFDDERGIWLSALDNWHPTLIIEDERPSRYLFWTPDDTRIIVRLGSLPVEPHEVPENTETIAYSLISNSVESWPWADCHQFGLNIEHNRFALICFASSWLENAEFDAIALSWGGVYRPYLSEEFTLLISDMRLVQQHQWFANDGNEVLYFRGPDPNYDFEIRPYEIWTQTELFTVSPEVPLHPLINDGRQITRFDVSPSQQYIAYSVPCNQSPGDCLEVLDIEADDIVWSRDETFELGFVRDIMWTQSEDRVVVYGSSNREYRLIVFNLAHGTVQSHYLSTAASGGIAVVSP